MFFSPVIRSGKACEWTLSERLISGLCVVHIGLFLRLAGLSVSFLLIRKSRTAIAPDSFYPPPSDPVSSVQRRKMLFFTPLPPTPRVQSV